MIAIVFNTSSHRLASLPSVSVAAIEGISAGVFGILFVAMILFLWYRRRHRKPANLPQEVLQAEVDDGYDETGDASTRLTPFVNSTISRYLEHPPPRPVALPSTRQNADGAADSTRSVSDAAEEQRRLTAALRERDQTESWAQRFGFILHPGKYSVLPGYAM